MSSVHICPVCGGVGKASATFYNPDEEGSTTGNRRVTCRACGGDGVIVVREHNLVVRDRMCPPSITYPSFWPPPNSTEWITTSCRWSY